METFDEAVIFLARVGVLFLAGLFSAKGLNRREQNKKQPELASTGDVVDYWQIEAHKYEKLAKKYFLLYHKELARREGILEIIRALDLGEIIRGRNQ